MFILLISCRKEVHDTESETMANSKFELISKVNSWLESQKKGLFSFKAVNIDLLKGNLDFAAAATEIIDSRINYITIPINDEIIKERNLDRNSTLTLLLIVDKFGKINSGSIVYFQPADGKKHNALPQNTFTNLISRKPIALDGVYKMLNITGRFLSQFEIKQGKLFSTGSLQQESKESKGTQRVTSICIDWYLVTTIHWADGTITQTREYVGRTCEGCGDGSYMSLCPDTDSGGDSSSGDTVAEGTDELSITTSQPAPDANALEFGDVSETVPIVWHAIVGWSYNYKLWRFEVVMPVGVPWPVPVSQGFTDSNGNPAVLLASLGFWEMLPPVVLTIKSVLVDYTIIEIRTYVFTTGTTILTFPEGLMKVITAP
jgi:hypothetical protein